MSLSIVLFCSSIAFIVAALPMPSQKSLPSRTWTYGVYAGLATLGGALLAFLLWLLIEPFITSAATLFNIAVVVVSALAIGHAYTLRYRGMLVRSGFEFLIICAFIASTVIAVFITFGIFASVFFESVQFFNIIPMTDFFFGLQWSPQIAVRTEQVGASGAFGFIPLLLGTLLISLIAMLVATPMGLLSAIYLSEFAKDTVRNKIKPILEILAGVPTIVYGFFAVTVLSPLLVGLGKTLGVNIVSENALAAGVVMGMMLIPFIASLSEDALSSVPSDIKQGALALGATRYESTLQVIVPTALPGIVAGILLAFSRAVGETMIVVMAAGISAHLSLNPLDSVTTITVQIVTLLTGDQTFDDPKTLAAFALGFVLFFITLIFNAVALVVVKKYHRRYE